MANTAIIPVLIGADMNCYSLARAFHEAYGVKSYAFGRWAMGDTMYSRIVTCTCVQAIDTPEVLLQTVTSFANAHEKNTCIVLGCTDDYASLLMELAPKLPQNCIAPYITPELRDQLVNKADFYAMCETYSLPYPKTFYAKQALPKEALTQDKIGFSYPVILKPSSSILYWKYPFEGMKKVYTAHSPEQASQILEQIYASGYPDIVLLQDMIPGDDSYMRVLTAYCGRDQKVKRICLGHVGLEEHTPKALGNHAAIITEYHEPLMRQIEAFLNAIGYVGFANFDIKFDRRDNTYRIFEINLRQGRSNYYVTGAGWNLANLLVQDYILKEDLGECQLYQGQHFWHSVPKGVVYRYVRDKDFIARAKKLAQEGKESYTFHYSPDLKGNVKRTLYYWIHMYRYYQKFKRYDTN